MRGVLGESAAYPYLMKNAVARLGEARHTAVNSGMTVDPLICLGGEMWCLFPWLGTYAFIALERFIKLKCAPELGLSALDSSRPYFIQFKMKAGPGDFFRVLGEMAEKPLDPMELVYDGEVPVFEKYDEFLPVPLVRKGFAHGILGINEMKERIRGWAGRNK
jgi:ATP-dependent Lhr-like helicase